MAFPVSPINGQIYKDYQYDSSKSCWIKSQNKVYSIGRWRLYAYFTPEVWHDVCLIYGRATIMAISSENAYMQPWLINFGWNWAYGQMISATMNPDMGHSHSRDFQWRVVDAGDGRGKLQTAAISYSTSRGVMFNVALLDAESSIEWLIGAM